MKVKVSEATERQIDWMVGTCEGEHIVISTIGQVRNHQAKPLKYSTDWSQGGPIIEREFIELKPGSFIGTKECPRLWAAWGQDRHGNKQQGKTGPTPLIAAMRCYVVSKLGDEVEVPDELR